MTKRLATSTIDSFVSLEYCLRMAWADSSTQTGFLSLMAGTWFSATRGRGGRFEGGARSRRQWPFGQGAEAGAAASSEPARRAMKVLKAAAVKNMIRL